MMLFVLVALLPGCPNGSATDHYLVDGGGRDLGFAPRPDAPVDTGDPLEDTKAGGPDGAVDTWVAPPDVPIDTGNGPDIPRFSEAWRDPTCFGDRALGASCDDHCQCETGYCYDEIWMAPFRYCTKFCGGISEGCGAANACVNVSLPYFPETYYITLTWFCMPRCANVASCQEIDPLYDHCPHPSMTSWDGKTIGPATCVKTGGIGTETEE